MKQIAVWSLLVLLFASCSVGRGPGRQPQNVLHFLDLHTLKEPSRFNGTVVGGLSGIDYDPATGTYYLISDDRSNLGPARFYTAQITVREARIDSVTFTGVHILQRPDGSAFPDSKKELAAAADPEAMRLDGSRNLLTWCSEGERARRGDSLVLRDPFIYRMDREGAFRDSFLLPRNLHMRAVNNGPRQNGAFEGLCFSPDYREAFVSLEEPLLEDGHRAGLGDSAAYVRILRYDAQRGVPLAQYAYRIEPVAHPVEPQGGFRVSGIADLLSVGTGRLLVLERSYSAGRRASTIRLFLVDLANATNVDTIASLADGAGFRPIKKTLLLNLDDLGIYTDNIEGICFGPRLANGNRSLILVSDNNFSEGQETQFLLFEAQGPDFSF